jgi:hypothetical protein
LVGGISFAIMTVGSTALGRRGFFVTKRLGWLPHVEEEPPLRLWLPLPIRAESLDCTR